MPDADLLSLGQWRWDSDALKLIISVEASSGFEGLNGAWTLSSIGHVLDGLSRRRLYDLLTDGPGREAAALCQLRLADGRRAQPLGRRRGQRQFALGDHALPQGCVTYTR